MPAFVYFLGVLLVVAGAAYAAMLAGIPSTWVLIGAVILGGLGIMAAAGYMRRRTTIDPTPVVPTPSTREVHYHAT